MWKVILSTVLAGFLLFLTQGQVNAACQCTRWEHNSYSCRTCKVVQGKLKCSIGLCTQSYCAAQNCTSQVCGPGYYVCNRTCCAVGVGGGGGGGGGGSSCSQTAPTNVAVTPVSSTKATVSWTVGAGAATQSLYAGSDRAKVETNCPSGIGAGTGCVLNATGLAAGLTSYTTGDILTPGTLYYWRVVTYQNASCISNSATRLGFSSCSTTPSSMTIAIGNQARLTTTATWTTDVASTTYTPSSGFVTVNPSVDSTHKPPYTDVTGVSKAVGTIRSDIKDGSGSILCTSNAGVTVIPPLPWWQVKDSDLQSMGDISSNVIAGQVFDLVGGGGDAGVHYINQPHKR